MCVVSSGPSTQDGDSDEEWPALGAAGAEDDLAGGGVVEVDPEDEKAIQMFMSKNPPVRLVRNCLHYSIKLLYIVFVNK